MALLTTRVHRQRQGSSPGRVCPRNLTRLTLERPCFATPPKPRHCHTLTPSAPESKGEEEAKPEAEAKAEKEEKAPGNDTGGKPQASYAYLSIISNNKYVDGAMVLAYTLRKSSGAAGMKALRTIRGPRWAGLWWSPVGQTGISLTWQQKNWGEGGGTGSGLKYCCVLFYHWGRHVKQVCRPAHGASPARPLRTAVYCQPCLASVRVTVLCVASVLAYGSRTPRYMVLVTLKGAYDIVTVDQFGSPCNNFGGGGMGICDVLGQQGGRE